MKVQGTFIANGTETKLTIANFVPDSLLNIQLNFGPGPIFPVPFQEILLEDVSLIPTDLHDWLHDTFCTIGDSVWVGLDRFDYPDGVWYTSNMQVIDTAQGFWYKPTALTTSFIQGVEVCGAWHWDTMNVYTYPLSSEQFIMNNEQFKIYPNPATASVTVAINQLLSNIAPIQILDAAGRVVYSTVPTNNYTSINTSGFAKGVYVVRYGGGNVRLVLSGEL
jgi:Secretion system C-terminal sorting domain